MHPGHQGELKGGRNRFNSERIWNCSDRDPPLAENIMKPPSDDDKEAKIQT